MIYGKKNLTEDRKEKPMNIKRAKEEIKHSIQAYLLKNEFGAYKIPMVRQRPILLMGPPGIGKTAIMEQVARECGIGLVSYTITHHTRQSAIGLPFIRERNYGGKTYSITEYTMSEIIASVYEKIEETGISEGILFIDEINCVSETLAPAMLQFLQCKMFGTHQVPEGWVIVAAGNPPEYNKSVREFDVVTLDRLKKIDVTEDFMVWKEYAYLEQIHGSILSYLEIKKENFYTVQTTVDGKVFVTARGWEDLSKILYVYEDLQIPVDEGMIHQYLQHSRIAKDFANYYDLYHKYKKDYRIEEIITGKISKGALDKLSKASFDEKLSVIGLLLSKLSENFVKAYEEDIYVTEFYEVLKKWKNSLLESSYAQETLLTLRESYITGFENKKKTGQLDHKTEKSCLRTMEALEKLEKIIKEERITEGEKAFFQIKEEFTKDVQARKQAIKQAKEYLEHSFDFMEQVFGENQEMVIFITELTMNYYSMKFISENGCERYHQYNQQLLFDHRQRAILEDIEKVGEYLEILG